MSNRLEKLLTIVLALAAVAVAASAVRRSWMPAMAQGMSSAPDSIKQWSAGVQLGRPIGGDRDAPVTVVAIVDLECPACAGFHQVLKEAIAANPAEMRGLYVHSPLSYHRFAMGAARGAECAAAVNRFEQWVEAIYSGRDSLGLKSWGRFARDAGIADTSRIAACATSPTPVASIDSGLAFAHVIGAKGTPTVIVNGWRFTQPPTRAALDSAVRAHRKGVGRRPGRST
jgi:protein-disulfide isomerase